LQKILKMEDNIICSCMDVSEHEIVHAIQKQDAVTLQDIEDITGAMSGCGSCTEQVEDILQREMEK
jgi:NAD(P)H-nitrite reductase large subunit